MKTKRYVDILKRVITKKNYLKIKLLVLLAPVLSDKTFLQLMFPLRSGYKLNLDNPKTYNEKLQWLKLYNHQPEYTQMVDKVEAKKYVAGIIGEEYIIPTLAVYDRAENIDFDALPNQFVLKCTHDSGGIVICHDKKQLDKEKVIAILHKGLNINYYMVKREWPYKNVIPRIIAESYMKDSATNTLNDYKVLCFNGKPKLIELHMGRFTNNHTQNFYDVNWNMTSITQGSYGKISDEMAERPQLLEKMLELSERLSTGIPHVRVDWYIVNGHLYFGELTFFDGSGLDPWDRFEDDLLLGSWITLPTNNNNEDRGMGIQGIDMFY